MELHALTQGVTFLGMGKCLVNNQLIKVRSQFVLAVLACWFYFKTVETLMMAQVC